MSYYPNSSARLLAVILMLGTGAAAAVDPMPLNSDGPVDFIPTVRVSQGYDDNIDEAPDGSEESSNVTKIAPSFLFQAQERANRYQFRYAPSLQLYSHDSDDNRVNHNAALTSRTVFNARNRLNLSLRGVRNTATLSETNRATLDDADPTNDETEGDINERITLNGTYRYGAQDAQGNLAFNAGFVSNRYANNLTEDGSNNQSEEYDSPRFGATFFWRVAPKTQLLFEGRYADFDYTWAESTLDSTNLSALIGARWQATGKTSGSVRFGRQEKDFDDVSKTDEDITSWEAQITWRPASYSTIRLSTANTLEEGSESATNTVREETIEQTSYSVRWQHQWDDRVSSNVGYSLRDKDYLGAGSDNEGRTDETTTLSLGLTYNLRRWLDLGFEARFKENDSNGTTASYDRNTYFLTATVSL